MTRIAMLLTNPFRPDPRVLKEARSLSKAGYKVTVICWDRKGELPAQEIIEGITIQRLTIQSGYSAGPRQTLYLPRFWYAALKALEALSPDVVHCHDLDTTPVGYWYAKIHKTPWIFDAHECYPEQIRPQVNKPIYWFLLLLERYMSKRATHIITVGELLAKRFHSFGGQVSVVGNYQQHQPELLQTTISRADLNISPDAFVIAYIGGFTLARAILPLIKATELDKETTVLLAGAGPQQAAVEATLPEHPQVHYLGWIPQEKVLDYMALADVIYYGLNIADGNSQYSSPNALFNALMVGKAVLTTNVGEIAQIVRTENCGLVVEEASSLALSQAIKQLRSPTLREQLSANAQRIARTKYNWTIAETTLLKVYQQIA